METSCSRIGTFTVFASLYVDYVKGQTLEIRGTRWTAGLLLTGVFILCGIVILSDPPAHIDALVPAEGFQKKSLSAYCDELKGNPVDTPVFIQTGSEPGGTILILGGTHPNEPAGVVAAILMLERIHMVAGRIIIVPFANRRGFMRTRPLDASPAFLRFTLPNGSTRIFRYGARTASCDESWPVSERFSCNAPKNVIIAGQCGNLNRLYPGNPKGSSLEQLAFGIMELIRREHVTLAFDLHEAQPENPIAESIVSHEKSIELVAEAVLDLSELGIEMHMEQSSTRSRGLSHREWGDATSVFPFLVETSNPEQGRFHGQGSATLVRHGFDKNYQKKQEKIGMKSPMVEMALEQRVARQIAVIQKIVELSGRANPMFRVVYENVPSHVAIIEQGIEAYLTPVFD